MRSGPSGEFSDEVFGPLLEEALAPPHGRAIVIRGRCAAELEEEYFAAVDLDPVSVHRHQELHHPGVNDRVGEALVVALHHEFAAELRRLEVDVVEAEGVADLVEEVLRPDLQAWQRSPG